MKKLYLVLIILVFLPLTALAQTAPTGGNNCLPGDYTNGLCNPLKFGNLEGLASQIFIVVGTIVGLLALTMLIYSGFRMINAQGNQQEVAGAKAGFTWTIIGFIISAMSYAIVFAFQNFIGVDPNKVPGVDSGQIINPLGSPDAQSFVLTIIQNFLGLVGLFALLMIIINGFRYMTAGGNDEIVKKAKAGLLWSVIGFLIIIASYTIMLMVKNLIGAS